MLTNTVSYGLTRDRLNALSTFDLSNFFGCKSNWSADGLVGVLFSIRAAQSVTAGPATVATAGVLCNSLSNGASSLNLFCFVCSV